MPHRLSKTLVATLLSLAAVPAFAASSLTFSSAAGDTIGQGTKGTWTAPTALFTANGNTEWISIQVNKGGEFFSLEFAPPRGQPLARGAYTGVERAGTRTGRAPGLDILSGNGTCVDTWGSFNIRQIGFDENGVLNRLEATFVQRCNASNAPALTGTLVYDAPPLSLVATSAAGDPIGGGVNRTHYGHTSDLVLHGTPAGLSYGASGLRDDVYLAISPPFDRTLAPGTYPIARAHSPTHVGIFLTSRDTTCDDVTGNIVIRALSFDSENHATGLNATLTAYCNGSPGAFKATIRQGL